MNATQFVTSVDAAMESEHPGSLARWNALTAPEPPTEAARYKAALERVLWLLERNRVGEAQVVGHGALEAGL